VPTQLRTEAWLVDGFLIACLTVAESTHAQQRAPDAGSADGDQGRAATAAASGAELPHHPADSAQVSRTVGSASACSIMANYGEACRGACTLPRSLGLCVQEVVVPGALPAQVQTPGRTLEAALHEAAAQGDVEAIERLAAEGAQLDVLCAADGLAALHRAAAAGHAAAVAALLRRGAKSGLRTHKHVGEKPGRSAAAGRAAQPGCHRRTSAPG